MGCGTSPSSFTVRAQPGQTVKVVDGLPPSGGVVILGHGAWPSGYGPTELISRPNLTIYGSGMAGYNSTFTALEGGKIVQGHLSISTGADYFTIENLGVDAGSDFIDSANGGIPTDAFSIANNRQVVGAPPLKSARIENVSCLGYSTTALFHCMLVENVENAYVRNVTTVKNEHGFVLNGTNSQVDGVYARSHSFDGVIVKSDDYAPTSGDNSFEHRD
jgi:hypothetical protein